MATPTFKRWESTQKEEDREGGEWHYCFSYLLLQRRKLQTVKIKERHSQLGTEFIKFPYTELYP
jgi:hypothetical protein